MNRNNKLAFNTFSSLSLQLTNIISAFILPRFILEIYGSEVNGLVSSITQFLNIVSLLDMGVGAVIQSSLYKPLAKNDDISISKILVSGQKFFHKIAIILLIYVVVLMGVYPFTVNDSFGYIYIATLILAMSISIFAQYYFGIVNGLLLTADQKGYIQYNLNIITIIVNTIACAVLIKLEFSIQIVKLTTSIIFLARPLYLQWYVKKHYKIDKKITYTEEPIKQKWNGMAQHFAAVVLNNTDTIVLTLFSTLSNVSVYSVYNLVLTGIKQLVIAFTNGFQSVIGEMLAKNEIKKLRGFFARTEWIIHTLATLIFGCTGVLIVDFVKVYTNGITDTDYIQPLFAILITLAHAGHCLRLPYNVMILAAGHYKQTQHNYIIAMVLNIVISIVTVFLWGLIGVAIGTFIALAYQTIWMAWYNSKNIISWSLKHFIKHMIVNIVIIIIASLLTFKIPMISISYVSFFILAIEVFIIWSLVSIAVNLIFYREQILKILYKIKRS